MKKKIFRYVPLFMALLLAVLTGCKKLVMVEPPNNEIVSATVYNKQVNATAVMNGLYNNIASDGSYGGAFGLPLVSGLASDELTAYSNLSTSNAVIVYQNAYNPTILPDVAWGDNYKYIFTANSVIEGVTQSTAITGAAKDQLLGEAKFCRAFLYFHLTNLYGDVPMPLSTDYQVNQSLSRTPQQQVWQQMISDLTDAKKLLSKKFLAADLQTAASNHVWPSYWTATAFLARVYLYYASLYNNPDNAYAKAASNADTVINQNGGLFSLQPLNNVFLDGSQEAIWQLPPTGAGSSVPDANAFILLSAPNSAQQTSLSSQLLSAFETGDQRAVNWINSFTDSTVTPYVTYYYPYKYKVQGYISGSSTEDIMMIRLAEQYLILAEADAYQNDLPGAIANLNVVRARAGLSSYNGAQTQNGILAAIMHERQVELFTEDGHRWFDLKRTGLYKTVMPAVCQQKGGTWADYKIYFPIGQSDIIADKNLTQTPGY